MCFQKEPFRCPGQFENCGELAGVPGDDGTAQHHKVRMKGQGFTDGRVMAGENQPAIPLVQYRRIGWGELDKAHAQSPRPEVVFFEEAVCHEVSVENQHIDAGGLFLQENAVFHRCGTTDPAAVRALVVSGAHALNHGNARTVTRKTRDLFTEPFFQFELGYNAPIKAVAVMAMRFILLPARGKHNRPFFQGRLFPVRPRGYEDLEVSLRSPAAPDGCLKIGVDAGVMEHLFHLALQEAPHIYALQSRCDLPQVPAQPVLFFNEGHVAALLCEAQRHGDPGYSAAYDEAALCDRDGGLLKRFDASRIRNSHAHQDLGLFCGLFLFLYVDPGTLVPDIGHLEEILVQTGISDERSEKGLVGPRGARSHHNPVQAVFFDGLLDLFLGILGTGKEVFLGMDDLRQACSVAAHLRHVHDTADIDAAVADENADAGCLSGYILFRRERLQGEVLPSRIVKERCGLRGCRASINDGFGDIFRRFAGAAGVNASF